MEFGEVVGILIILGVLAAFGYFVYREKCCPECGAFRSIKRVEVNYTPVDDEVDFKDIVWHLFSEGAHRTKSSLVKWVDRCRKCGYETNRERFYEHF